MKEAIALLKCLAYEGDGIEQELVVLRGILGKIEAVDELHAWPSVVRFKVRRSNVQNCRIIR